eukprot:Stramenopile-MAST_4_protein_2012
MSDAARSDEQLNMEAAIVQNLKACSARVLAAFQKSPFATVYKEPTRLVAVSKIKPLSALMDAYNVGHRHFGENYVQEILDKAPQMPDDVAWHFIGHLQSNKVNNLLKGVPSLFIIETVDTIKLANKINNGCKTVVERDFPLKVMVQVNTSGETSKSGCEPADCADVAKHIIANCDALELAGLMTIGSFGEDYEKCFQQLVECRENVAADLGVDPVSLELSMGMSGDFETAIAYGSTNVRCGSNIFGARDYSQTKK